MSKAIPSRWKPGQSGNPKGRKALKRPLSELLRKKGDEIHQVGGNVLTGHELLAGLIWQLVLTGEVKLVGESLRAESVAEWVQAVKWLAERMEPRDRSKSEAAQSSPEMVVQVVRSDLQPPRTNSDFNRQDAEFWKEEEHD